MSTTTVIVTGMTCGHCVASVREEVAELQGVSAVEVDLSTGRVDITSEGPIAAEDIANAVAEAGYTVA